MPAWHHRDAILNPTLSLLTYPILMVRSYYPSLNFCRATGPFHASPEEKKVYASAVRSHCRCINTGKISPGQEPKMGKIPIGKWEKIIPFQGKLALDVELENTIMRLHFLSPACVAL
jgi:hypothetical protein